MSSVAPTHDAARLDEPVKPAPPAPRARRARARRRLAVTERGVGIALLVCALVASIVVPAVRSTGPGDLVGTPSQAPSGEYLLGTDSLGRDILVRTSVAIRTDLTITVVSVAICMIAGLLLGVLLASCPSAVRTFALRLIDALLAIPFLILVLALIVALGRRQIVDFMAPGVAVIILAIAMVGWAPYVRLTVAQAMVLRQREAVIAARLLGYSRTRILLRHVGPAVLGVNLSYATSQAIVTTGITASLAFLGAGVPEPTPELGAMMQQGIPLLATAWWITVVPGLAVLALGVGFALIADSFDTR